jgi:hypothetical protein
VGGTLVSVAGGLVTVGGRLVAVAGGRVTVGGANVALGALVAVAGRLVALGRGVGGSSVAVGATVRVGAVVRVGNASVGAAVGSSGSCVASISSATVATARSANSAVGSASGDGATITNAAQQKQHPNSSGAISKAAFPNRFDFRHWPARYPRNLVHIVISTSNYDVCDYRNDGLPRITLQKQKRERPGNPNCPAFHTTPQENQCKSSIAQVFQAALYS